MAVFTTHHHPDDYSHALQGARHYRHRSLRCLRGLCPAQIHSGQRVASDQVSWLNYKVHQVLDEKF